MFTLIQTTPTGSDCTTGYMVKLDKIYTLKEFIDAVLSNQNEWGRIIIATGDAKYSVDYPQIGYKKGKLTNIPSNITKNIIQHKVLSAIAHGGYSNMDYTIWLEKRGD